MTRRLREAWTKIVKAEDYEAHMAAVGQAQANAGLIVELFERHPPSPGAEVWMVGAGTGQLFEFASANILAPFRTTFSDISPQLLDRLAARISGVPELKYNTVIDDVENSHLPPGFELVIAVLVLEHVDFQKAIATMCRLSTDRVFVVLQENPAHLASAITKSRPIIGSMRVFTEVNPNLLPKSTVKSEFLKNGFELCHSSSREVLDAKKMLALEFQRRPDSFFGKTIP